MSPLGTDMRCGMGACRGRIRGPIAAEDLTNV
jgi:hypothetical protein